MIELLIVLGSAAVCLAAGVGAGWHFGRAREMRRVSQRVSIVLGQVERRHKKELNRFQTTFSKQAQELRDVQVKLRQREAADQQAQAQARAPAYAPPPPPPAPRVPAMSSRQKLPEHGFAPTQPMQPMQHVHD